MFDFPFFGNVLDQRVFFGGGRGERGKESRGQRISDLCSWLALLVCFFLSDSIIFCNI